MNDENVNVTVDGNRRSSSNNCKSYCNSTRIRTLFLLSICSLIVLMIIYAILYNNKKYLQLIMMSPTTTKTVRHSTITTGNTTTTTVQTVDEAAAVIEATHTTTTTTTGVDSSNTNNSNIKPIRDTALHYQTTTKSTNKNQNNTNQDNQNTNQNKNDELFINTFADCVLDPNCHLLYHHVGKTGGTTIEKIFSTLFPKIKKPSGGGGKQTSSCCFSEMLHRFQQDPYHYCLQQKFSAYQVRGKQFETIVLQCLDLVVNSNLNSTTTTTTDNDNDDIIISTKNKSNKNKSNKNKSNNKQRQHRFLTFSTYREPIARTISDIHQLCNKNLNRRTKQLQEVCQRCTYDSSSATNTTTTTTSVTVPVASISNDKLYWNKLIHNTNRIYRHLNYLNKHLLRHSHYRQISQNQNTTTTTNTNTNTNTSNNNTINIDNSSPIVIDYLMMDVIDIDDFLHRLDQSLVLKQQQQQQQQSQKQKQNQKSIIRIPYLNNDNNKNSGHGHGHVIKSNQESIKFCNFGKQIRLIAETTQTNTSTSTVVELEIVELLQESIDIYNNFTTN